MVQHDVTITSKVSKSGSWMEKNCSRMDPLRVSVRPNGAALFEHENKKWSLPARQINTLMVEVKAALWQDDDKSGRQDRTKATNW